MKSCAHSSIENNLIEVSDCFNHFPLPSWLIDQKNLKILAANYKADQVFGYNQDELKNQSFPDLFAISDQEQLIKFLYQPSNSGRAFLIHNKGKKELPVKLYVTEINCNDESIWQVSSENISVSDINNVADNSENYNRYKLQSSEGTWCYELEQPLPVEYGILESAEHFKQHAYLNDCNKITASLFGFDHPSGLLGMRLGNVLNFDNQETIDLVKSFKQNDFKLRNVEIEIKREGVSKYMVCNFFAVIENNHLTRIWGTHLDITEKKEAEKKVEMLACLLEESYDVLATTDLDWNHITWNKGAENIYKIPASEILGKNIRSLVPSITYVNFSRDEVRTQINENGFWKGEMSFIRPADNKFTILFAHFKQLKDEKGIPVGYVFSGTDITEKKQSELQLKETENRFVEIANTAPVMIWMTDGENNINYVNKSFEQFTGLTADELKTGWKSLIHPADLEKVYLNYEKTCQYKLPVTIVIRLLHKKGTYRWVLSKSVPRILGDGTYIGCISTVSDIHGQKLRERQLRYQDTILKNISDLIITTDLDHHVVSCNNTAEQMLEIKADDIKGKFLYNIFNFEFDCGKTLRQVLEEFHTSGIWKGEASIDKENGEKKHFFFTISYIIGRNKNKSRIMVVGRDITERKEADAKLLASEQFYRNLIADIANGVLIIGADGKLKFISDGVQTILGFDSNTVIGMDCWQFIHPEDYQIAIESFQRKLENNPDVKSIEVRIRKNDGDWLWCLVRGYNLMENPYVQGIVVYFHDDTERKKANDALKESERRFRTLIRDIQVGVILLDTEEKILLSNRAINEMLLLNENEIYGKSLYDFTPDVIDEKGIAFTREDCPVYKAIKNKTQVNDVVMGVYRPKNNDRIWIMMNADPILDADGELIQVICSIKDISERKKLEDKLFTEKINHQKQLTQATIDGQERERREIGKELHDNFGQQLTTIKLFLDMAKSSADDGTNEMISMALKGVSDVINGMRRMSRNLMPPTLGDLGLIDSIFDLIEGINRTQAINIEFDFFEFLEDYISENKQLMTFRIIQEQLNNIIKHAQAENVSIKLYNNEAETFLEIVDDGKGFDIKTVKKGLGLTNIRNRAEIFGGTVTIDSAPGKGCHLKVYVPNLLEHTA